MEQDNIIQEIDSEENISNKINLNIDDIGKDDFIEKATKELEKLGIYFPEIKKGDTIEVPNCYNELVDIQLRKLEREHNDAITKDFNDDIIKYSNSCDDEEDEDKEVIETADNINNVMGFEFEENKENKTNKDTNEIDNVDITNNNIDCGNKNTTDNIYTEINNDDNNEEEFYEVVEEESDIKKELESKSTVASKLPIEDTIYIKDLINNRDNSNKIKDVMKSINLKPPKWAENKFKRISEIKKQMSKNK